MIKELRKYPVSFQINQFDIESIQMKFVESCQQFY